MASFTETSEALERFSKKFAPVYFVILANLVIIFVVLVFVLSVQKDTFSPETISMLNILIPVINFSGVGAGAFIYQFKLKQARSESDIGKKLEHYKIGYIIRLAFIEGMGVIDIIMYHLTDKMAFLILFILIVALYAVTGYPTQSKLRSELQI